MDQILSVPSNVSYDERITRGKYSLSDLDLTEERFPVTADQIGDWDWKLFVFGRDITSEEAVQLIKEAGFEAGQIGHILAFGEKYPEQQQTYLIIGLGLGVKMGLYHFFPVLTHMRRRRWLYLHNNYGRWHRYYRFLGVRRITD